MKRVGWKEGELTRLGILVTIRPPSEDDGVGLTEGQGLNEIADFEGPLDLKVAVVALVEISGGNIGGC